MKNGTQDFMYDLIIKNGRIVDGTGRDAFVADIGIKGEKIAAIGNLCGALAGQASREDQAGPARTIIDAKGKWVTPGFIEPHSHVDMNVLFHPSMETYLMQGVTTVVSGNCGHGMAPMGEEAYRTAVDADRKATEALTPSFFRTMPPLYVKQEEIAPLLRELYQVELDWHSFAEFNQKCETLPIDCNIAPLVGHSAIRNTVMGMDCERRATEEEIRAMEELTRACMEQGAFGFSTGRDSTYVPSVFAGDEEIIRLLRVVRSYDGIFTSHTANFTDDGFDNMAGYEEFFRQAKAAGVRANISHVQLMAEDGDRDGAVAEAERILAYFEQMEAEGVDFSFDTIPVADVSFVLCPYLASVFGPFVRMLGTRQRLAECLAVPDFRQMVRVVVEGGMLPAIDTRQGDGIFGRFHLTGCDKNGLDKSWEGRLISQCARDLGTDPLTFVMDLLTEHPDVQCGMSFQPCREAYDLLYSHRFAMPCLDGNCVTKDTDYSLSSELPEYPAPFYYNGMASYLLHSKRSRFEDTVRQMTGFVAERFGIAGRGLLQESCFADILVIDREDLQSYEADGEERKYPDGFDYVIVNGVVTVEKKRHLGVAAGHVLRKG